MCEVGRVISDRLVSMLCSRPSNGAIELGLQVCRSCSGLEHTHSMLAFVPLCHCWGVLAAVLVLTMRM